MVQYRVSKLRHKCWSEPFGLAICLLVRSSCGEVLFCKVAANGREELRYKQETVVRIQISFAPEWDYPMNKGKVWYMLRVRLGLRDRSR